MSAYFPKLQRRHGLSLLGMLAGCVILISTTPKTPNSGWMSVYAPPEFPQLFTGIPVLRPWVPVERLDYALTGNLWLSSSLAYALVAFLVLALFYREALRLGNERLFWIMLAPLSIVIYLSSWAGPLYDITFALGLIVTLILLSELPRQVSKLPIVVLVLALFLVDMSRPTGSLIVIPALIFGLFWFKCNRWILFVGSAVLLLPFHIMQWTQFHTIALTTFSGSNLYEAIHIGRDCLPEFARRELDSLAMATCSNEAAAEIRAALLKDPSAILSLFTPKRLAIILTPNPNWQDVDFGSSLVYYTVEIFTRLSIVGFYVLAFLSLKVDRRSLLGLLFLFIGIITTLLAHSGFEAARVMLPFVLLTAFLALGARWKAKTRKAKESGPTELTTDSAGAAEGL
ncbi:MAG: hypothetical protein Q8L05_05275 [Actinomycetota bacterium]|nr:hypothetical protein [Actinomycetota bacterium]MDP2287978.1 hypothetical protein [Actinomycetota bacterium]